LKNSILSIGFTYILLQTSVLKVIPQGSDRDPGFGGRDWGKEELTLRQVS
jgi:hypothetical protein